MPARKQALELPYERDERIERPGPVRRVIVQAARDLKAGLVDTDNYTRAATITAGEDRKRARRMKRMSLQRSRA